MRYDSIIHEDIKTIVRNLGDVSQKLSGKTLLISGGAGFLGRHFLRTFQYLNRYVLKKPLKVISLDNYITGDRDSSFNNDPNISTMWADVTNPLPARTDVDYIIHAAGLASPVYYQKYPLETIESAVTGAKNLLELGRKNKLSGFLFFSSSEIYGDPDPKMIPTPETYFGHVSSVGPRACYDESKRLTETICMIYKQQFGLPVTVVRPFNVFGPGMKHNDFRVVPMFTYESLNNRLITVHGDGHQTRTFCYITDAINGFLRVLLLGKPGEAYNIGSDKNEISMRNFASLFSDLMPDAKYKLIPYPPTYPAGEPQRRCPDLTKSRTQLKFEPKVLMRDGVERFVRWAKSQPSYIDPVPSRRVTRKKTKKLKKAKR